MPSWKFDAGPRCVSSVNFDNTNFYVGADTGLWVADIDSENIFAWDLLFGLECTSVWSNNTYLYYGTNASGIYRIEVATISGELNGIRYKYEPEITSNTIKYIHGYSDKYLFIATTSGLDFIWIDLNTLASKNKQNVFKTWVCSNGSIYYAVSGTKDRLYHNSTPNLDTYTTVYVCTSGDFSDVPNINDFYVTERTSSDGIHNTLFIAASGGAFVFDEGTKEIDQYVIGE